MSDVEVRPLSRPLARGLIRSRPALARDSTSSLATRKSEGLGRDKDRGPAKRPTLCPEIRDLDRYGVTLLIRVDQLPRDVLVLPHRKLEASHSL